MGNTRQPVELIQAKGRKHLTEAEIKNRTASEVHATPADKTTLKPPKWLAKELRKEFRQIAGRLIDLKVFTDLDGDALGYYLTARESWRKASTKAESALSEENVKLAGEWSIVQDRYFKQAAMMARELGLTISSRCKLVIPEPREQASANPFLDIIHRAS